MRQDEPLELSRDKNFDLQTFAIDASVEQTREKRLVRIGAIQNNAIVLPTHEPVAKQRDAIFKRVEEMIDEAALCGVNVLCSQEACTMPFAFCSRTGRPFDDIYSRSRHALQHCDRLADP